jgi:hypothetical protein
VLTGRPLEVVAGVEPGTLFYSFALIKILECALTGMNLWCALYVCRMRSALLRNTYGTLLKINAMLLASPAAAAAAPPRQHAPA